MMERVKGIEPSYSAWEAAALPLSYTRVADGLSQPASVVKQVAADVSGATRKNRPDPLAGLRAGFRFTPAAAVARRHHPRHRC